MTEDHNCSYKRTPQGSLSPLPCTPSPPCPPGSATPWCTPPPRWDSSAGWILVLLDKVWLSTLLFSSGVSPISVDTMCRSLGHKRGFKLPPSLLGHPDNLPPHFVLQVTEQYIGSAQSFVDSLLSARAMRRTSLTAGSPPGTVGAAKTTTSSPSSAPTSLCQSQA